MSVKRIFVAIDVSEDVRTRVAEYVSGLRHRHPANTVRWEPSIKYHLTMRFVGDVDESAFRELSDKVDKASELMNPFRIAIGGSGAFEDRGRAVLWIGAKAVNAENYQDPFQRIATLLNTQGVSKRRFRPHLTIARIKKAKQVSDLIQEHLDQTVSAGECEVNSLTIYESSLLPTGSVYTVISKHPFSAYDLSTELAG